MCLTTHSITERGVRIISISFLFKADSQVFFFSDNRTWRNNWKCYLHANIFWFNSVLFNNLSISKSSFHDVNMRKRRDTTNDDLGPTTQGPMGTQDPKSTQEH